MMNNESIIVLPVNPQVVRKYFDEDFLRILINPEGPNYETMSGNSFHIREIFYESIVSLVKRNPIDTSITNELCFILQILRILDANSNKRAVAVESNKKTLKELARAISMYNYLISDEYEITKISIEFSHKSTEKSAHSTTSCLYTASKIEEILKQEAVTELQLLKDLEEYFNKYLAVSELVDKNYKLSPIIYSFLKDHSRLRQTEIYGIIGALYELSDAEVLRDREFHDIIKNRVKPKQSKKG